MIDNQKEIRKLLVEMFPEVSKIEVDTSQINLGDTIWRWVKMMTIEEEEFCVEIGILIAFIIIVILYQWKIIIRRKTIDQLIRILNICNEVI